MSDNNEFTVGQKVTLVETNTPGTVIRFDHFNVVVEDENGKTHAFMHGTTRIVPQTFLTENN
jgi:sRNA-binding regulator protein Hfq